MSGSKHERVELVIIGLQAGQIGVGWSGDREAAGGQTCCQVVMRGAVAGESVGDDDERVLVVAGGCLRRYFESPIVYGIQNFDRVGAGSRHHDWRRGCGLVRSRTDEERCCSEEDDHDHDDESVATGRRLV